jgi:membrane protein YqaA with SNARE-associated domain
MFDEAPDTNEDVLALPSLIKRLVGALAMLLVASFLAGLTLKDPITAVSGWFVESFGLWGIFLGVMLLDCLPLTMSEPLLLLGYEGKIGFWTLTTVAGMGSWLSALLGYSTGLLLGKTERMRRVFRRYRMDKFMDKYGITFVAVAAITPFPYGISTVCAGASKIPLVRVMLAALLRFPKNYLYTALVIAGWSAST